MEKALFVTKYCRVTTPFNLDEKNINKSAKNNIL